MNGSTIHKQKLIRGVDKKFVEIDEGLSPLIAALWAAGLTTTRSCQCHEPSGKVWIEFPIVAEAERFVNVGAGESRKSISRWIFGEFGRTSDFMNDDPSPKNNDWEFHVTAVDDSPDLPRASVNLSISVLFPTEELEGITRRWQAEASAKKRNVPAQRLDEEKSPKKGRSRN